MYSASANREREQLFLKRPGELSAVALPGTEGGVHPFFSPDGVWVAFFAEGSLKKVSVLSGSVEVITRLDETAEVVGPGSWGEEGNLLFPLSRESTSPTAWGKGTTEIASVASGGGPVTFLSKPDSASGLPWHLAPQRLPGTDMVLYTATSVSGRVRVMAQPLGGGAARLVLDRARFARYLGNGRLIYEVDGDLFTARFDLHSLVVSEPTRVLAAVALHPGGRAWDATSNVLVYRPRTSRALVWVRRDGLRTRLGLPSKDYSTPVLSPGGDRVAVIVGDDERSDVWIGDLRREIMTKVSSDGLARPGLSWTPDGNRVTLPRVDGVAARLSPSARMAPEVRKRSCEMGCPSGPVAGPGIRERWS